MMEAVVIGPSSAAIRQVRSASDTVSVSVENGALVVNVIINGQGPFPMMFDTGGVEAITPETATALGLSVEGEGTARGSGEHTVSVALTHLKSLRLGGAELSDIALPVHTAAALHRGPREAGAARRSYRVWRSQQIRRAALL